MIKLILALPTKEEFKSLLEGSVKSELLAVFTLAIVITVVLSALKL